METRIERALQTSVNKHILHPSERTSYSFKTMRMQNKSIAVATRSRLVSRRPAGPHGAVPVCGRRGRYCPGEPGGPAAQPSHAGGCCSNLGSSAARRRRGGSAAARRQGSATSATASLPPQPRRHRRTRAEYSVTADVIYLARGPV